MLNLRIADCGYQQFQGGRADEFVDLITRVKSKLAPIQLPSVIGQSAKNTKGMDTSTGTQVNTTDCSPLNLQAHLFFASVGTRATPVRSRKRS